MKKAFDSIACLVCGGLLMAASGEAHTPAVNPQVVNAQTSQSQTDSRARQLQQQPPKINDQEWQAAVNFMRENCPNRINFVMTILQDRPIQLARAKELILRQYRQIANNKDREFHEIAVKQAQIQDTVFVAQLALRNARAHNDPPKIREAQTALKAQMDQLVDVQIVIRQVRIARLQTEIERFMKKRPEYVNTWYNDEMKKATSNNLDGTGHGAEDAVVDQEDTKNASPPPPPLKK